METLMCIFDVRPPCVYYRDVLHLNTARPSGYPTHGRNATSSHPSEPKPLKSTSTCCSFVPSNVYSMYCHFGLSCAIRVQFTRSNDHGTAVSFTGTPEAMRNLPQCRGHSI